ncbi:MAG: type II toxin-antitoxin system PemK/MazF family toxin [Legionellaceae bacterium]|nr:type II toxin-antitoxin system PemK/MazF family toxin [Legionellaceae bacterium]
MITLTRGGVYLARLDPAKHSEVGKIRPVTLLTAQLILDTTPEILFICPLSGQSYPEFRALHMKLTPRDRLLKTSYALVEHCRSISIKRLVPTRLAQLTPDEISTIITRLQRLLGS